MTTNAQTERDVPPRKRRRRLVLSEEAVECCGLEHERERRREARLLFDPCASVVNEAGNAAAVG
jgi:hypothetical protein